MGELDVGYRTVDGDGMFCGMTAGYKFKLKGHPAAQYNTQYVITTITHRAEQSPGYTTQNEIPDPYQNYFTCITHGAGQPPYIPERKTPKPVVKGSQTATVVGPAGEEIFTDKYGRIKVQFHWDRHGKNDPNSSCWMRVIQPWAGKNWGSICIPRIGHEVIVEFLEGDPDQPIVGGSVYNPSHMPPYKLPENANMMGFKSDTTPGGNGYNELAIVDGKNGELFRINAQKDMDTTVLNDDRQYVVANRTNKVDGKQHETIKGDKTTIVSEGDRVTQVKAGCQQNIVMGDILTQSESGAVTITSPTQINLVVGKDGGANARITLNSDGLIEIAGKNIRIIASEQIISNATAENVVNGSNVLINMPE